MARRPAQKRYTREELEYAFTWLCKGLAVVGFLYMLATVGFVEALGPNALLLGLFFGPEAVKGQMRINRKADEDE